MHDIGTAPKRIVFISDFPEELDAAKEAGLQTVLTLRPGNGNARVEDIAAFKSIESFETLSISRTASSN